MTELKLWMLIICGWTERQQKRIERPLLVFSELDTNFILTCHKDVVVVNTAIQVVLAHSP